MEVHKHQAANNSIPEELLDKLVEAIALKRINEHKLEKNPRSYSFEDIFGKNLKNTKVDDNDGWE